MKEKQPEFRVITIQDTEGIPEGASIVVQSETKHRYKGLWPNGPATLNVSVLKKHCEEQNL
jgi:hypothetical protein